MTVYFFAGILFSVFTSVEFFVRKGFFYGSGTTDLTTFFSSVPYICIIVIPVICIKTSKEALSDFVPFSAAKKIFGKFKKLMSVFFIMILTLIVPVLIVALCGEVDAGQVVVSLVCLFFYGSAAVSLCILIGTLVPAVPLYLIISASVLAVVNSAHLFPLYTNLPSFFATLARTISFAWHFDSASKGIADTRDLLFFIVVSVLFLYLAFLSGEGRRGRKFSGKYRFSVAVNFLILFMIALNSGKLYRRFDFSKSKAYSVSSYTKILTEKIESPLKITYYRSASLVKYYPQVRSITDFLESYASDNKNISFYIKNPDKDEQAVNQLKNWEIPNQQLRTVTDNSSQFINVYSAIILEYNGLIQAVPFILSAENLEYDLALRVQNLITRRQRIVNIVIGNGMDISNDYGYLVPWLNSQGFICNYIDVNRSDFASELENSSGPLLVFGDSMLLVEKAIAIEDYILSEKGNAFFAVSPFSVNIEDDWSVSRNMNTNLVEILENWGVLFEDSIINDLNCSRIQLYSQDDSSINGQTDTRFVNYPMWIKIPSQANCKKGLTLFWPSGIFLEQNAESYLFTSATAFKIPVSRNLSEKQRDMSGKLQDGSGKLIETNPFNVQMNSEKYESFPAVAIVKGSPEHKLSGYFTTGSSSSARIIAVPDQYFVNSLMTGYNSSDYSDYRGFEFLVNALLKLNGEEELAVLHDKHNFSNELTRISSAAELIRIRKFCYVLLFGVMPVLAIIVFVILSEKNRNQYKQLERQNGGKNGIKSNF